MSDNPSPLNASAALDSQEIECRVEAFQTALHGGQRPSLDEFLPAGGGAVALLVELIHIEMEYRLKQGEAARVEEYLARYPRLAGDSTVAVDRVSALWPDLDSRDAGKAHRAMIRLTAAPTEAVAMFRNKLAPASPHQPRRNRTNGLPTWTTIPSPHARMPTADWRRRARKFNRLSSRL